MTQTLKNDLITVIIDTHGAEIQSITDNRSQYQYLWQGDKAFWGRRSPVLFPLVGAVWNGRYSLDDKEFALGQHGFARDMDFEIMPDAPENEAWFALGYDETTLAKFPRRFRLEIGYGLEGERLSVMWRVKNLDDRDMPFNIGAHPAFNLPGFSASDRIHGYFLFGPRELNRETITEKGCVGEGEQTLELDSEGMLPITASTFDHDAIILAGSQVHRVSLLDKDRAPYLSVLFNAPLVGLWAPAPSAPFVCIEPWWGRCDRVGYDGDFAHREYTNTIAPGRTFESSYMVIFENL